jgi:hypothetical protein
MRTMLIVLGMLGATVGTGIEAAIAQYGDALPIAPGGRCPSNYTIQQGMCRPYRAYRDDREYRRSYRDRDYDRRGYEGRRNDEGRGRGEGLPAQFNRSGSAVCPSGYDYVQRRNGCFPQ